MLPNSPARQHQGLPPIQLPHWVPIRQALAVPLMAPVSARLTFPQPTVAAGLNLMDLTIPFNAVTLGWRETGAH